MTPLNLGILGCGRAALDLHLPALSRLDDVRLVAAADADSGRLDEVAKRFAIERRFTDPEALIRDSAVEVVVLLVPVEWHHPMALSALEAGKHVFIEKPLALTLEQADALVARAEATSCKSTVGFNLRWHRHIRHARTLIREGRIGTPLLVQGAFTSGIAERTPLPDWRRSRTRGGGVLFEIATHHFDLWRFLFDSEIDTVQAETKSVGSDDDVVVVQARLHNGVLASGVFSQRSADDNWLHIHGTGGRLDVSCFAFDGLRIQNGRVPPSGLRRLIDRELHTLKALPAAWSTLRRGGDFLATYEAEWRHFIDCIRHNRTPETTLHDGREALRAVHAAFASLQEKGMIQSNSGDL